MIPAGKYKARAIEGVLAVSGTGSEQVAVLLRIAEGDRAGEEYTWYGYFSPKTIERTMLALRTLGWTGDDLTDLSSISGNECSIVIEHEDDRDGNPRVRVKWINAPGGIAVKDRLEGDAAKRFAARMRDAAIASRAPAAREKERVKPFPKTAPQAEEASPFGDDIPF